MTDRNLESPPGQALTADDIEAAYERALAAMESVEVAVDNLGAAASELAPQQGSPDSSRESETATAPTSEDALSALGDASPASVLQHPREVIEAALFVGGQALTTRRLSRMFGDRETPERIDEYIHDLNRLYDEENRPYQIDFGEGGYGLVLRPEFEAVRDAVYGAGPKEVRLSQDALEVLAFVAYRQPVTVEDLQDAGREKPSGLLRQLLRRQLIAVERDDQGAVTYATTPRFLDLFALRSLEELPLPEDLELK